MQQKNQNECYENQIRQKNLLITEYEKMTTRLIVRNSKLEKENAILRQVKFDFDISPN